MPESLSEQELDALVKQLDRLPSYTGDREIGRALDDARAAIDSLRAENRVAAKAVGAARELLRRAEKAEAEVERLAEESARLHEVAVLEGHRAQKAHVQRLEVRADRDALLRAVEAAGPLLDEIELLVKRGELAGDVLLRAQDLESARVALPEHLKESAG